MASSTSDSPFALCYTVTIIVTVSAISVIAFPRPDDQRASSDARVPQCRRGARIVATGMWGRDER